MTYESDGFIFSAIYFDLSLNADDDDNREEWAGNFGRPLSPGKLLLLLQCCNLEIEFSPIDYPSSTAFQRFLTYSLLACLAHMDRFFFRHSSFSAFLFLLSYLPLFAGPTSAEQQRHSQLFGHFLFIFIFSSGTTFFWRHVQLNSLSIEGEM